MKLLSENARELTARKMKKIEIVVIVSLTSSISLRETFFLSLLGVDIEAESVTGASVLRFCG